MRDTLRNEGKAERLCASSSSAIAVEFLPTHFADQRGVGDAQRWHRHLAGELVRLALGIFGDVRRLALVLVGDGA